MISYTPYDADIEKDATEYLTKEITLPQEYINALGDKTEFLKKMKEIYIKNPTKKE